MDLESLLQSFPSTTLPLSSSKLLDEKVYIGEAWKERSLFPRFCSISLPFGSELRGAERRNQRQTSTSLSLTGFPGSQKGKERNDGCVSSLSSPAYTSDPEEMNEVAQNLSLSLSLFLSLFPFSYPAFPTHMCLPLSFLSLALHPQQIGCG